MDEKATPSPDDVVTCPGCGGTTMTVQVHEGGALRIVCVSCGAVVALSFQLIRVSPK